MMKVDQRTLRGKSANQIKHLLLAESMQKQKINAEQAAAIDSYIERQKNWIRSSSVCRDICSTENQECRCEDIDVQARVCRKTFSASLSNMQHDLNDFTYTTEQVLHDARLVI